MKFRLELDIFLINWHSDTVEWDYERFADSSDKMQSETYFKKVNMGNVTEPTTVVDVHGKIFMWYLPGLLLSHRVVCFTTSFQNLLFLLLTFWSGGVE